ncbi:uncharacterized mitochondrial protein AtMg00810-like [Helianthus annuus]|uniref:uncharacterized mitochondrial protein AtMg00810-like n=1 Tax=Helianthus annuus TaxID=4232 RepID=UPI000B8F0C03|nr:uncharacterized mitochondrial protein AtMg00810-like [Helianthus annuus]
MAETRKANQVRNATQAVGTALVASSESRAPPSSDNHDTRSASGRYEARSDSNRDQNPRGGGRSRGRGRGRGGLAGRGRGNSSQQSTGQVGSNRQIGVDCGDTFSPVVKQATIRTVLSLALSQSWKIHQLDVTNAFLHGNLHETVYMYQPMGFRHQQFPDHVCLLKKSLYGLKRAPRAWYQRFTDFVISIGFRQSRCDHSLFVYHHGTDVAYLLIYVDDIILTTSTDYLRDHLMRRLGDEFAMKDLGPFSHFLGVQVTRTTNCMFLSQQQYTNDIIERAGMTSCNPVATPVDCNPKLSATSSPEFDNPTQYRSLAGALQYLTFTRPDISYAVQQVCMYMHSSRVDQWNALKRIIRYLKGTTSFGLTLGSVGDFSLRAYTDADWVGCPDTRRSTSGYCVYLGSNLLSWSSKRKAVVSRSSAEAEYRGVANVVAELS